MTEEDNKTEAKVKVVMKDLFYEKINWFIQNYDMEIGAFIEGKITEDEIILSDLLIPEQEADKGGIEIEGSHLVKLRKEYKNRCKNIIGEWHSHNDMRAFWSATDEEFIKAFAERKEISVYVVSSKNDGHLVRVEVRNPFFISIDNVGYKVDQKESKIGKLLQKEIDKKIKEPTRTYTSTAKPSFFSIPNMPSKKGKNKEINKQLNQMIKYFNNTKMVEVYNLSWYWSESLKEHFKPFFPRIKQENQEDFMMEFEFSNKSNAIKGMKEIREYLFGLLLEEDDLKNVEDEFARTGGGVYGDGYSGYQGHPHYIN